MSTTWYSRLHSPLKYFKTWLFAGNGSLRSFSRAPVAEQPQSLIITLEAMQMVDRMMVIIDRHYRVVSVNNQYLEYTGKMYDEAVGSELADILGEELFVDTVRPRLERAFSGETGDYHNWNASKYGINRYFHTMYIPNTIDNGRVSTVLVTLQDLTEHKLTQHALTVNEDRFRIMFDNRLLGTMTVGITGRIISANKTVLKMLDISETGYENKNLFELVHSECQARLKETIEECKLNADGFTTQQELGLLGNNGEQIWTSVNFNVLDYPEQDFKYIIILIQDISWLKKAETELRQMNRLYMQAERMAGIGHYEYDQVNDMVVSSSRGYNNILSGTDSETGGDAGQPVTIDSRVHPEDLDYYQEVIRASIRLNRSEMNIQYRITGEAGIRYISEFIKYDYDDADRCLRRVGTIHDITDLEEQKRKQQIQFSRQEFFSQMSTLALSIKAAGILDILYNYTVYMLINLYQVSHAGIFGLSDGGKRLKFLASFGWGKDNKNSIDVSPVSDNPGCVDLLQDKPLVIGIIREENRYILPSLFRDHGIISVLGVPLMAGGKMLGTLGLYSNRPKEWKKEDVLFLESVGHVLSQTMERVTISSQIYESRERLRNLTSTLHRVRDKERASISREIHDELGQIMTSIRIDLGRLKKQLADRPDLAEKVSKTLSLSDTALNSVRRISKNLHPAVLYDLGLEAAIESQLQEFTERNGISHELKVHEELNNLGNEIEMVIYRVFQEAMTNIARHAHARNASVHIRHVAGELHVSILDDGIGYEESSARNKRTTGITGMQERVGEIGGRLTVKKHVSGGTIVNARLPLDRCGAKTR